MGSTRVARRAGVGTGRGGVLARAGCRGLVLALHELGGGGGEQCLLQRVVHAGLEARVAHGQGEHLGGRRPGGVHRRVCPRAAADAVRVREAVGDAAAAGLSDRDEAVLPDERVRRLGAGDRRYRDHGSLLGCIRGLAGLDPDHGDRCGLRPLRALARAPAAGRCSITRPRGWAEVRYATTPLSPAVRMRRSAVVCAVLSGITRQTIRSR